MNWIKRFLNPPQTNFQELLIKQGEFAIASVEAMHDYLKKPGTKRSIQARKTEKEADEIQRILIHELEDTFVTPLDREDIFALSRAIDNFIDYVYDTVTELEIFERTPKKYMHDLTEILMEMANEIHLSMQRLVDHPGVANEHARRIKALENQIETVYRESLADLFKGPEDTAHIMEMLKAREVLRHMSNAGDQGDRAADIVLDIGIKWS